MGKKLFWALAGLLIALPIVGGIVGTKVLQFKAMAEAGAQFSMPPEPVNVVTVRERRWQSLLSTVGSVMAVQGTVLSSEAEGVVREINFTPGAQVQAGDVLIHLDTDVEEAQLHAAEVDAELARVSYQRARQLSQSRNISQAELDTAATRLAQTQAQIRYIRALMAKKVLTAPFSGRLGILRVSVGHYLAKGSPVVSLQSLDPVFVEFSLPQRSLGELSRGLKVMVHSDAYPDAAFEGTITAVDPDIDLDTRNVRVQATLANPDEQLRPGMFVALEVVSFRYKRALMVPATAVQYGPQGDTVFIVEARREGESEMDDRRDHKSDNKGDNKGGNKSNNDNDSKSHAEGGVTGETDSDALVVRQQPVKLGERHGDFVVVIDGVAVGEQVVSTGVFKLRPGMAVVIDNTLAPEFSLVPSPDNS
ncbi:efflux RND transporter periplasmic adaptor subunit [Marinobacter caseinilyticus]|uniref:efflux RND transporter periplasmic adaptor subunit n=1 Tax=Marinobacter caseinilyticus TaxID=2692195 RepID=UPI00140C2DA2|nr:efflux RND transporter periplasmic adaptor subunit [Marinobacter caseinilyticus]